MHFFHLARRTIVPPHALLMPLAAQCGRSLSTSAASSRSALIKELRSRTSAPMKKCVEALNEANGDVDEAATILRKAGLAAAQKKAGRGATEGATAVAHGNGMLAVVEVNSETDFVARNELFQVLVGRIAQTALSLPAADSTTTHVQLDPAAISAAPLDGDVSTVGEALGVAVSQLGENLVLRRACRLATPPEGGLVASYVHNTYSPGVGRTAAAVALRSSATDTDAVRTLGERLAMHVVAAAPQYLDRTAVPEEALERERTILAEQAAASGKSQQVIDKMVEGRLKKFYGEVCLLEQQFLIDDSAGAISKVLEAASKDLGAEVSLDGFVRYHVGEEAA